MSSKAKMQFVKRAVGVQQYVYRLFYGEMLAQVSRYPLRVPVRIMPGSRRPQAVHQDRFIQQGAALLAGLGLCISSFSLKKLSAMPHKPRRLI
ncbi:uncharacterized protein LOC125033824 isoform X2 [Penaeus chinensis]|uniref:uncharacterized protein LOC125033824 isoform X2 n=1 Tax=Penaeus chinensis TaxID=139456 RepID=UPI001FB5D353|nr:uncharacterized protein LOC125033824 isoform X2 [Penaeus chinensis]